MYKDVKYIRRNVLSSNMCAADIIPQLGLDSW